MILLFCVWLLQSFDDAAALQAVAAHRPEEWALIQAYLAGEKTLTDLKVAVLRRVANKPPLPQRNAPTLDDVIVSEGILLDFYGGDRLCDGPRARRPHAFAVPSYVSLTYRRLAYDVGPEGYGDESMGVKGEGVGVIYSGLVMRIWGYGFHIELETDPLNGVTQRIEMVHFAEETCGVGPASVPCLKVKGLFTFNWQVRDGTYQVRYAHRQWQDILQLADFYYPARYVMVAGTPCIELRGLGEIDAGYAEGRTRVWQTALPFYWSPCGDFFFSHFHRRTQHRMNPWPGHGMPLLAFTTTKPTEKQRDRTHADLEVARDTPTELDIAAGVDPRGFV